jgi:large subunit ribosomal protein L35Ae
MSEHSNVTKFVGVIKSYRRSGARQYNEQVLVQVFTDPKLVGSLVGAKVIARDKYGNVYRGKVIKVHSFKNCVVVVRFKPNIPGQLLSSRVEILKG